MLTIEVDDEVYDFLRKKAEIFVDTPNTVLRKLLLKEGGDPTTSAPSRNLQTNHITQPRMPATSSEDFVRLCWRIKFSSQPRKVSHYKTMWESDSNIVYFQNHNKYGSPNLWYRLHPSPLEFMRSKNKRAWVCFTNPAENFGYLIPLEEIIKRVKSSGWDRDEIEVNIDVANARWRELAWGLKQFEFKV